MTTYGGEENASRVADICQEAHRIIAAGRALLAGPTGPCDCRYPDGLPKYTTADKKLAHRCGR